MGLGWSFVAAAAAGDTLQHGPDDDDDSRGPALGETRSTKPTSAQNSVQRKQQQQQRFLIVEGNVGAGKSTLCQHAKQGSAEGSMFRAALESVPRAVLRRGIAPDASRAAVASLQMYMLGRRIAQVEAASDVVSSARLPRNHGLFTPVLDRGPLGDLVFATVNRVRGILHPEDYEAYVETLEECGVVHDHLARLARVVYLDASPVTCLERCRSRGNAEEVDAYDLAFLDLVEAVYFSVLVWASAVANVTVRVVRWDPFPESLDVPATPRFSSAHSPSAPVATTPAERLLLRLVGGGDESLHSSSASASSSSPSISFVRGEENSPNARQEEEILVWEGPEPSLANLPEMHLWLSSDARRRFLRRLSFGERLCFRVAARPLAE